MNQTYRNIEIVLVQNGSDDSSPQICDALATYDERIKVIHLSDNVGIYGARNIGLRESAGEYIGFVDSDDMIKPNMYKLLYDAMQKSGADVSECSFEVIEQDKMDFAPIHPENLNYQSRNQRVLFSGKKAFKKYLTREQHGLHIPVWTKLIKRQVITSFDEPIFPDIRGEDICASARIYAAATSVVTIDSKLYLYRVHATNSSLQYNPDLFYDSSYVISDMDRINRTKAFQLDYEVRSFSLNLCLGSVNHLVTYGTSEDWRVYSNLLRDRMLVFSKGFVFDRYLAIDRKLAVFTLRLGYWAYLPLRNSFLLLKRLVGRR